MSTTTEQKQEQQSAVESPTPVSTETENAPSTGTDNQGSAAEEQKSSSSSWFNNLGLSPNLTNQLTNLSSSLMQVTSKVSAAANTFVQKSLPQRPSSPNENEQTEVESKNEEGQQTSEENPEAAGTNKDLTSMGRKTNFSCFEYYLFRYSY